MKKQSQLLARGHQREAEVLEETCPVWGELRAWYPLRLSPDTASSQTSSWEGGPRGAPSQSCAAIFSCLGNLTVSASTELALVGRSSKLLVWKVGAGGIYSHSDSLLLPPGAFRGKRNSRDLWILLPWYFVLFCFALVGVNVPRGLAIFSDL